MQLLFVVVPTISLLACMGLFSYAVLADGFETRGRVESFTQIDHSQSHAVSFVRHALYAGAEPAPYSFERGAIVAPWSDSTEANLMRELDSTVKLSGGNIRSRLPHQMVSIHNKDTRAEVKVQSIESGSQALNRLGVTTDLLFYVDEGGKLNVIDSPLENEQSAIGRKIQFAQLQDMVRTLRREKLTEDETQFETNRYRRYYGWNTVSSTDGGDVNRGLNDLVNQPRIRLSKPGSYLAISSEYPEHLEPPAEKINYKSQLHVVLGER